MTPIRMLVAGAAIAVALAWDAGAEPRAVKQYTMAELLNTIAISGASFSPDGSKILVTSDETGIYNAFAIPIDGSRPAQLTRSTADSVFGVSYFPGDERFIYTADQGGNELNHIYVRELDGTSVDLTPGEKLKASFLEWAHDKKSFFIESNERDPRYFDLYEVSLDGYKRTLFFKNEVGYSYANVSPDKRQILMRKEESRKKSDVYVLDRQTGEIRKTAHHDGGDVLCNPQHFAPDGKTIHCLTDMDHEFQYLVRENLETGEKEIVEKLEWDIVYTRMSETAKYLIVAINNDARTEFRLYDMASGKQVDLPAAPGAGIESIQFNRDDTAVAFYVHGGRTPGDLFYYDLAKGGAPLQLTHRLDKNVDPNDLVEPEVVRFDSYDGVEIPGILYKPHQADATAKVPALVYVHGGPGGQTRATYTPLIQYLSNHGYAVYAINNRGSSGYGKTFYALDDLKHGEGDLDDCVASKKMLADTGYVDPERIGIIGGSYGGYMVCAALAFRPQEFNVGVDIFGVTNWVRTLKSIPAWWEAGRKSLYQELGDPATQEEYLRKISPLFHAKNIVKPMIVLQGANDPRVLQVESDEMVAGVRANGVPVEYVVFPDEGHGFRKKENQISGYEKVLAFLDEHLKKS